MRRPRLRDPLRRSAFRRLALSFAINEMGDWLGLVALSVLVFERTGSALVHRIGNVAVLYRPRPDLKRILIPD